MFFKIDVRPNSPSAWTVSEQKQSKINIDNIEQKKPGIGLSGGQKLLPLIEEDPYTVAVLKKEISLANNGIPLPTDRQRQPILDPSHQRKDLPPRVLQPVSNSNLNIPPIAQNQGNKDKLKPIISDSQLPSRIPSVAYVPTSIPLAVAVQPQLQPHPPVPAGQYKPTQLNAKIQQPYAPKGIKPTYVPHRMW